MILLQNVDFFYQKDAFILQNINLELKAGKIYGLLGQNGAGKSTLLNLITGLLFPQKGTIQALGHIPQNRVPSFLGDIFYLPEEMETPPISPEALAENLLGFYPKFSMADYIKYLTEFDIDAKKSLKAMSLGTKKKVWIALGLATNTSLLLLDEPTNGLDISGKSQFRKMMIQMLNEDRCIVISTHQIRDLETLMDNLLVLHNKKIVLNNSIEELEQKYTFTTYPIEKIPNNALYLEKSIHQGIAMTNNVSGEPCKLQLEVLFNAIAQGAI